MDANSISLEGFAPLLSDEVRNDKVAKSFITASVNLANITAELSQHLEAPEFEALKAKVVDFFTLVDEVLKAVTPEEKVDSVVIQPPAQQIEEVDHPFTAEDLFPVADDTPVAKVDPSVAAIFNSMPAALKQAAVTTLNIDLQNARLESVREERRIKFKTSTATYPQGLIDLVKKGVKASEFLQSLNAAFGEEYTEYEAAIAYAEIFRAYGGKLV